MEEQKNNTSEIETKNEFSLSEEYNWSFADNSGLFGEVIFLPIYSSIYHQNNHIFDLTATLTIHNIDLNHPIIINKIDYFDTDGKLIKRYLSGIDSLFPLQSRQYVIHESDRSGGTAAKFVVQWYSKTKVVKPLIESVMISTTSQQGISFKAEHKIISSIGY
jgi:hypothetical protein